MASNSSYSLDMSYNLRMGANDPENIDIESSWEVNYWSFKLECSKEDLIAAAKKAGPKLDDIRKRLGIKDTPE